MSNAEATPSAKELLQERSRETLVEGLLGVLASMDTEQSAQFVADLLLALGADRDHLAQRLTKLLSTQFGSQSEKATAAQVELFAKVLQDADSPTTDDGDSSNTPVSELIEQTQADIKAEAAALREKRKAERAKAKAEAKARRGDAAPATWPDHLPVHEHYQPVPDDLACCDDCGQDRKVLRYETSWRIEYLTSAEVHVEHAPVLACPSHHGGPVSLPVTPKPVDSGRMGFSLAARILWLRATHNLPVRRIVEMLQADGVPVTESMVHTLLTTTGERTQPVVEAIQAEVQQSKLVNIDDTFTDVYEGKGSGKRKRRRARVWLALGDEVFAYYFATKTWSADEAEKALGSITGVLQGDGYKGFPGYAATHGIKLAGCMAHLRRKFHGALKASDSRAGLPMALIDGMYKVEELAKLRALDADGILALRQERSLPMMSQLLRWARDIQDSIVTGSPLGEAYTYLLNQFGPLQVFLSDGNVSIDNNAAERGLRRHTIGRKLWLFFRDQTKLEHLANILSVVTTARLHGADELAYLTWLLERLATRQWSAIAARQLLPAAWLAMQEKAEKNLGAQTG